MIVPTDGNNIEEVFWELLEAFDPDYIFDYQKTGLNVKLSSPPRFEDLVRKYLDQESGNSLLAKVGANKLASH